MEILETLYNEIITFFGISNAWEILNSEDKYVLIEAIAP